MLVELLRQLLETGRVAFREPPRFAAEQRPAATAILHEAYAAYQLDIAGPRLDFQAETAVRAAEATLYGCWFLVHHGEPIEEVELLLLLPPPQTPADHLSADLVLRFLVPVYRRAGALAPADPLRGRLAQILRQWPLSGVLADVADGPLTPPDFGGHSGLLLLYAERWLRQQKIEWLPPGPVREYVEWVLREQGQELPVALQPVRETTAQRRDDDDSRE